jgi:hypothetical protein
VSPREDRIAIGNAPPDTRGCGAAMVFSPTARRIRRLTAPGKVGTDVSSWSRGGSRLAYALNSWGECGRITPSARLFVTSHRAAQPDSEVAAQADGDFGPAAWSPDARRIAFPQCDGRTLTCRLVIFEIATGRRKVLGGNPYPLATVWATDSNEVITARAEPNDGIWAFDADSGRMRRLSGSGDIEGASADGGRLVIYRSESSNRGVLTVESATFWPFPLIVQRRVPIETGAAAYFVR